MANSLQAAARNNSLANRQSTVTNLTIGALVGVINNEEFSKGGRSLKFSTNAYVSYRPLSPVREV